jgi:hypothetical protein
MTSRNDTPFSTLSDDVLDDVFGGCTEVPIIGTLCVVD